MSGTHMESSLPLEAKYANYFQIGQNALEVVIEFGQLYSGDPEPLLHTRIVTNPMYAKDLLNLLQKAIEEFQSM